MSYSVFTFFLNALGPLLLISGLTCYFVHLKQRTLFSKVGILLLCVGVSMFPVNDLTVAEYLRGLLGDLSVPTQFFLVSTVVYHLWNKDILPHQERWLVLKMIGIGGLILYFPVWGYWNVDSYSLGYCGVQFLLFLILLILWTWHTHPRAAVVLLISMGAYSYNVLESTNVWDYFVDPGMTIYAWVTITFKLLTNRSGQTSILQQ